MAVKAFLVVVVIGVALIAVSYWLEQPWELTPDEAVARLVDPEFKHPVRHETPGRAAWWAGTVLFVVGAVGLFFSGARRSFLTDGVCHE